MTDKLDENMHRRRFMKLAIGLFNGLIALLLAVPGLGFLLTPVLRKGSESWVKLGALEKFSSEQPQKVSFKYVSEVDYSRKEKNGFVWVLTKDKKLTVFSPVCTHTGCNVAWRSSEGKFACPCHEGRYDLDGNVISGPPPKPLTKLTKRIENGQLLIQLT